MKLLKEIKDIQNISESNGFKVREAARAILIDDQNKIPMLYVSKKKHHKIPGGGIDNGESKKEALIRESLEEVGCKIEILKEVGEIIEYRKEHNLKQTSYCYIGKIIEKGEPDFTEKELNDGFRIIWLSIDEAILKMKSDNPEDYGGKFMRERDLIFLEEAKKIINN